MDSIASKRSTRSPLGKMGFLAGWKGKQGLSLSRQTATLEAREPVTPTPQVVEEQREHPVPPLVNIRELSESPPSPNELYAGTPTPTLRHPHQSTTSSAQGFSTPTESLDEVGIEVDQRGTVLGPDILTVDNHAKKLLDCKEITVQPPQQPPEEDVKEDQGVEVDEHGVEVASAPNDQHPIRIDEISAAENTGLEEALESLEEFLGESHLSSTSADVDADLKGLATFLGRYRSDTEPLFSKVRLALSAIPEDRTYYTEDGDEETVTFEPMLEWETAEHFDGVFESFREEKKTGPQEDTPEPINWVSLVEKVAANSPTGHGVELMDKELLDFQMDTVASEESGTGCKSLIDESNPGGVELTHGLEIEATARQGSTLIHSSDEQETRDQTDVESEAKNKDTIVKEESSNVQCEDGIEVDLLPLLTTVSSTPGSVSNDEGHGVNYTTESFALFSTNHGESKLRDATKEKAEPKSLDTQETSLSSVTDNPAAELHRSQSASTPYTTEPEKNAQPISEMDFLETMGSTFSDEGSTSSLSLLSVVEVDATEEMIVSPQSAVESDHVDSSCRELEVQDAMPPLEISQTYLDKDQNILWMAVKFPSTIDASDLEQLLSGAVSRICSDHQEEERSKGVCQRLGLPWSRSTRDNMGMDVKPEITYSGHKAVAESSIQVMTQKEVDLTVVSIPAPSSDTQRDPLIAYVNQISGDLSALADKLSREIMAALSRDETIRSVVNTMETLRDYPMPNVAISLEGMFSVDESRAVAEEAGRSFLKRIEDIRNEHLPKLAKTMQELFGFEEVQVRQDCQEEESAVDDSRDETPASVPDRIRSLASVVSEDMSRRQTQLVSQIKSAFEKIFIKVDVGSVKVMNTTTAARMLVSPQGKTIRAALPVETVDPDEARNLPSIEISFVGPHQFDLSEESGGLFSENSEKECGMDDESIEIIMATPKRKSRLVGRGPEESREDDTPRGGSEGSRPSESRDSAVTTTVVVHPWNSRRPRLSRLARRRSQEAKPRRRAAASKAKPVRVVATTIDPKIGYSF